MPDKAQPAKSGGQSKDQHTEQCQPKAEQAKKKHANKKKTPVGQYAQKNCCLPPKWMPIAKAEVGTRDIKGKKHNKRVLEYHSTSSGKYKDDETSWCGSFVNWSLKQSGYKKTIGIPERAKAWIDFGKKTKPIYGAIGIKPRKSGGHVAFVMGVDDVNNPTYIYMLGGNQDGVPTSQLKKGQKAPTVPVKYKGRVSVKRYDYKDWNLGFVVPKDYNDTNCKLNVYKGSYVIGKGDSN